MITQPPIDKLIEMAGNKYSLCVVIAKRARFLNDAAAQALDFEDPAEKPISQAAQELFDGKITIVRD